MFSSIAFYFEYWYFWWKTDENIRFEFCIINNFVLFFKILEQLLPLRWNFRPTPDQSGQQRSIWTNVCRISKHFSKYCTFHIFLIQSIIFVTPFNYRRYSVRILLKISVIKEKTDAEIWIEEFYDKFDQKKLRRHSFQNYYWARHYI